jgi:outer membrane immunogenic protein
MKKITLALAAATALISAQALAADLRPVYKAPPAPVVAPYYNWSGFYLGAHIGGGWSDMSYLNTANTTAFGDIVPADGRFNHDASGVVGGGQVGFNWQTGNIVFGLEASFSGTGIEGGFTSPVGTADDQFRTSVRTLFLGTGRLGYAFNNWMVYVTGGYAGADVRARVSDVVGPNVGAGSSSQWLSGYTIGAGLEYAFTQNLSLGLQYNFVELERGSFELGGGAGAYTFDVKPRDMHIATARLNYRFNWGGPVMASY